MFTLIFEDGIDVDSWKAIDALRTRVSMSATGSVIVIGGSLLWGCGDRYAPHFPSSWSRRPGVRGRGVVHRIGGYQLALRTPGSSPACAISRKQTRQSLNRR
jgi:hypothetical protein